MGWLYSSVEGNSAPEVKSARTFRIKRLSSLLSLCISPSSVYNPKICFHWNKTKSY
jgi:hypothetical protein